MKQARKWAALLLVLTLAMVLWGCAKEQPEASQLMETTEITEETTFSTEATVPLPEMAEAVVRVTDAPVVLEILHREDTVELVDSFDNTHYVVKGSLGYGLVEKHLVRLEEEPAYEARTGYARDQAAIYDNFRLVGTPVNRLAANTSVEIQEDLGSCLLIRFGEMSGYMAPDSLLVQPVGSKAPAENSGKEKPPVEGEDGGDISLSIRGGVTLLSLLAPQEGTVSGRAVVLAEGTPVVLGYLDREQRVQVVMEEGFAEEKEGYRILYLDGLYSWIAEEYIRMADEPAYEAWDGFSTHMAELYDNFWLSGNAVDRLNRNEAIRILEELEHCYLVERGEVLGYMAKEQVSTQEIPWHSGNASGNSQSGSTPTEKPTEGNSGSEDPEWSPPML